MNVKIKAANLRDDRALIRLESRCFKMKYDKNFMWFWKPLTEHAYVYKAVFNGKIIGGVLAVPTKKIGTIYVDSLFVDTKFRHHGIATKLIAKIENLARCREIILDTMLQWKEAVKLYKRLGFRSVKLMKNYYEDGTDRILMVKRVK